MSAAAGPPRSEPANSHDFLPKAIPRWARSADDRTDHDPGTPENQEAARIPAQPVAGGGELLQQHVGCEAADPPEVHNSGVEQQHHQHPPPAEAKQAFAEPLPQATAAPRGPDAAQKTNSQRPRAK